MSVWGRLLFRPSESYRSYLGPLLKASYWQVRLWAYRLLDSWRYRAIPARVEVSGVPHFGQFESANLTDQFFDGRLRAVDDPKWATSGAASAQEYADWVWHICGVTCFKMILAHATGQVIPTIALAKGCQEFGGYVRSKSGVINPKGLHYDAFCRFIAERFGWTGRVVAPLTVKRMQAELSQSHYVIASVHPSIHQPATQPPARGGHLVLVTGYNAKDNSITYSDPCGRPGRQDAVVISQEDFGRFFAHRGIVLWP